MYSTILSFNISTEWFSVLPSFTELFYPSLPHFTVNCYSCNWSSAFSSCQPLFFSLLLHPPPAFTSAEKPHTRLSGPSPIYCRALSCHSSVNTRHLAQWFSHFVLSAICLHSTTALIAPLSTCSFQSHGIAHALLGPPPPPSRSARSTQNRFWGAFQLFLK